MTRTQKTLFGVCLLGLLAAPGAYYLGKEQDRIRFLYGEAPQVLSVAELAQKGYGNNIWLDLTDVKLGAKYVALNRKGTMSAVWFPAFPREDGGKAKTIEVVLRSTKCRSEADIARRFANRSQFRGAVTNPTLLTPYEPYRGQMQAMYPSQALSPSIWEVDIDYDKPSPRWATGFYNAAAALAVLAALAGLSGAVSLMSGPGKRG